MLPRRLDVEKKLLLVGKWDFFEIVTPDTNSAIHYFLPIPLPSPPVARSA